MTLTSINTTDYTCTLSLRLNCSKQRKRWRNLPLMTSRYGFSMYFNERCFRSCFKASVMTAYVISGITADANNALHYIMYNFLTQVVLCISVDVSSDYSQVESVIKQVMLLSQQQRNIFHSAEVLKWLFLVVQAQEKLGPVDMLVNCAGTSLSGKFEDVEVDRFKVGTWGV